MKSDDYWEMIESKIRKLKELQELSRRKMCALEARLARMKIEEKHFGMPHGKIEWRVQGSRHTDQIKLTEEGGNNVILKYQSLPDILLDDLYARYGAENARSVLRERKGGRRGK